MTSPDETALTDIDRELVALCTSLIAAGLSSPEVLEQQLIGYGHPHKRAILDLATRLAVAKQALPREPHGPASQDALAVAAQISAKLINMNLSTPEALNAWFMRLTGGNVHQSGSLQDLATALAAREPRQSGFATREPVTDRETRLRQQLATVQGEPSE